MILEPYLTSFKKMNCQWIKDLNVRPNIISMFIERKLFNIGPGNDFFYMIPKNTNNKRKKSINRTSSILNVCAKEAIKLKCNPWDGRKRIEEYSQ